MTWSAQRYLKFDNERTRAAVDLANHIDLDSPKYIVDLGCGPGNSTQVLRSQWPDADIIGLDSSPEMIAAAQDKYPDQHWQHQDAAAWAPSAPADLVYSNAALHWISNHAELLPRLIAHVAPGGALAFQIPSSTFPKVRELIHEISRQPKWDERMIGPRSALTMHPPGFYYDILVSHATRLDIWETEYQHVLDSKKAIVEWISSTGLRPFLAELNDETERVEFLTELQHQVDRNYETQVDGKVLFAFRRTFVVAYR